MSEKDFVISKVIPLLKALGFDHVRYTHGSDEYGRDIIFYDIDKFGIEKLFCAQAKFGDISGDSKSVINEITNQFDDAFKMPYYDSFKNENKYVSGIYLIISGKYTRNAKEKIKQKSLGLPIYFLDINDIDNIDFKFTNSKDIMVKQKLHEIKRKVLAESRCAKIDFHYMQRKLNEIDLIETYFTEAKIEVLSDIGLEVTLHSLEGTKLLVEQLKWYVDTGFILSKTYRKLLGAIISILWTWGIQAVEYQRNISTVETILDGFEHILLKIIVLKDLKLYNICGEIFKRMINKAAADNHLEIKDFIVNRINELPKNIDF